MLTIQMHAPEIGGRIGLAGNPEIVAVDQRVGIAVSIEVESSVWKEVLRKLGTLQGVGIIPANQLPKAMGHPDDA